MRESSRSMLTTGPPVRQSSLSMTVTMAAPVTRFGPPLAMAGGPRSVDPSGDARTLPLTESVRSAGRSLERTTPCR
jgi:hypothetical protein